MALEGAYAGYPVNFSTEHREMLGHAKMLMESEMVAINRAFNKLVTGLTLQ